MIYNILTVFLIATIILILIFIFHPINKKCPIWQDCKHYRKGDSVCNETKGDYYSLGKKCGSYYNQRRKTLNLDIIPDDTI